MTSDVDRSLEPLPIESPLEIRQVLEQLQRAGARLALRVSGDERSIGAGRIEALGPGFAWLRVDNELTATWMRDGLRLEASTRADGIAIRFEVVLRHVIADPEGRGIRLSCALPRELVRVQRREAYRIRTAGVHALGNRVRRIPGGELAYTLLDLSADGVAIELPAAELPELGTLWRHSRLEFPGYPPIPCDLRVRALGPEAAATEEGRPEDARLRVGCVFERPSPEAQRAIQAYVIAVQRHARSAGRGAADQAFNGVKPMATPACS
jgi:c-di-GMP-binding flagellar brake protein YcgR